MIMKPETADTETSMATSAGNKKDSSSAKLSNQLGTPRPQDGECSKREMMREEQDIRKKVFDYLDENKDGKISAAELQRSVRTAGGELSMDEAEKAVESSDTDGDGGLGFGDFSKLMESGEGEAMSKHQLREAFQMYATEKTGCITPKSLKRMLRRLGQPDSTTTLEHCEGIIRTFDLNGDGVLDFNEFLRIMMNPRSGSSSLI